MSLPPHVLVPRPRRPFGRAVAALRAAIAGTRRRVARLASLSGAIGVLGVTALAAPAPALAGPDCSRAYTLGLHEHGLLYDSQTGVGIDKDIADEMARRSGCRISTPLMPRARIWQLIESGALDFSLSGITNPQRDGYAAFAWYVANKYYLLVRKDAHVQSVRDFQRHPQLKLGIIRSFRYGDSANKFVDLMDDDQRVVYATSLDPLYEILLANKVQAMIIEPFDYPVVEGASLRAQTQIVEFDDPPVPHGLIMSRKALTPAQQLAWRELIESMRTDGTIRRIFEKYFPPELARTMTTF